MSRDCLRQNRLHYSIHHSEIDKNDALSIGEQLIDVVDPWLQSGNGRSKKKNGVVKKSRAQCPERLSENITYCLTVETSSAWLLWSQQGSGSRRPAIKKTITF